MPRPDDNPDVKASKALAYILRHGAEKEGLEMRQDGYIKLADVLARPKLKEVDQAMVLRLVAENAKQRFELFYGYDPSPPRPKKKKGQGKGKGKPQPKRAETGTTEPGPAGGVNQGGAALSPAKPGEVDAAAVDVLSKNLEETNIHVDLPLVSLPVPEDGSAAESSEAVKGEYFIRATQGHSIKLENVAHLEPVGDDEESRARAGVCVHGTRWELWDVLKSKGLSRMARTHVHLAPALANHRILPRPNSTLRIYLDIDKLAKGGIPLFTSSNGVVLTPGNAEGAVPVSFWRLAERKVDGQWVTVLKDGVEV